MNNIWNKYETCKEYLQRKNLVANTNKYWNFYLGKQWEGCETSEPLPFMNIIKPVIKYKVSTVSQNNVVANYSDALGRADMEEVYKQLNKMFAACWEKSEMDTNVWKVIKEGAIAGDSYAFFGTKDVRDIQILSNMSVLLGDEQNPKIQEQPFILIRERLAVGKVKEIAKANKIPQDEIETIRRDEDTDYLVGNREDVDLSDDDAKVTSILYMEKKDGVVHMARATRSCIYQPLTACRAIKANGEPSFGLKSYPLVNFVWEDVPNSARGQGEVQEMIPNQIEVNKTLARISMSIKMTAFPRIAYASGMLKNPGDLDKTGAALEIQGGSAQSINQMISYLNPMAMSSDARVFLNDMMDQTRELAGASDTSLGQISDPTRVAASAIIAIRDQSALPLNEQVAKTKKLTEDLARLWVDIWFAYNPDGLTVSYLEDNVPVTITITAEQMEQLNPDVRIDVSQDTPWTKNAEQQALDNMLDKQYITFEEYVELSPDSGPIPRNKLKKTISERVPLPPEGGAIDGEMPEMPPGTPA